MNTKQQEAIREMASKKLLNGEQKRVLYRLFEAKINALREKFSNRISSTRQGKIDEVLSKARKNKETAKILSDIETARKVIKRGEDALKLRGLDLNYNNTLCTLYSNKEMREWEDGNDAKVKKIEDLKAKLLSDIYCLPMSADEMTAYIEEEISKINKE